MKELINKIYKGTNKEFLKLLDKRIEDNKKTFIITANPETLTYAESDEEINKMLNDKDNLIVPDGIAIVKAANILKIDIKERITGFDICEHLLEYASINKKKVFLFGSKQEVIDGMKDVISTKYKGIDLVGTENGYVKDKDKVFERIIKLKPDIVMVALGIPNQEKLIYKYLNDFKKGIFIGVGGSFDVISGTKKRAPKLFIKLNLEWLYRITTEPKRLKRFYNNNIKFILKVRKEK
jgi:N-acetylglucosaminyldiphosphoundecaprenol N-acetyl-beta-D-mannosaminyltransferase